MADEKHEKKDEDLNIEEIPGDDLGEVGGGTCGTCGTCSGCSHSGCGGCGSEPVVLNQT